MVELWLKLSKGKTMSFKNHATYKKIKTIKTEVEWKLIFGSTRL